MMLTFEDRLWVLDCEPRPVQLEAIRRSVYGYKGHDNKDDELQFEHLREQVPATGWGHFLEMRLGKTPTTLNEFELLRQEGYVDRGILVVPQSYKGTWGKEIQKFLPSTNYVVLDTSSSARKDAEALVKAKEGLLVMNYEAFRSEATMEIVSKHTGPSTYVAYDESISLKGHNSGFTKSAINLSSECAIKRGLTGKPITQGPQDLWGQLRSMGQINGDVYHAFRNRYCKMGGFKNKKVVGTRNEERLSSLLHSTTFIARKPDWMHDHGVQYVEAYYDMTPEQKQVYVDFEKDFMTELENGDVVTAEQIVTRLLKQQQIASGFIYDEDRVARWIIEPRRVPKTIRLLDMLETELTGKVVVPYQYRATGAELAKILEPYSPALIMGTKDMKDRELDIDAEKARFNGDPKCRVILAQTRAAKFGHTLVGHPGHECYDTFIYENTYNLDDRAQIEQRNQGGHQERPTNVMDFIGSPMEERIIAALRFKEDISATVIGYARDQGVLPHSQDQ